MGTIAKCPYISSQRVPYMTGQTGLQGYYRWAFKASTVQKNMLREDKDFGTRSMQAKFRILFRTPIAFLGPMYEVWHPKRFAFPHRSSMLHEGVVPIVQMSWTSARMQSSCRSDPSVCLWYHCSAPGWYISDYLKQRFLWFLIRPSSTLLLLDAVVPNM